MGWETVIPTLFQYGVGAGIAGILLWILWRILIKFMQGLKEDRANYMKIIEIQSEQASNHIAHLDESVKGQSAHIAAQGKQLEAGFDRTVEAIKGQTEILKAFVGKG